ncbi:CLUMA_CG019908, isoform A [Clunio marinus]|uniref:CLUMA_CG019908, isoform A n=1 Tax=Clunio marinus TaxID=568069 RepID=A0A1J1J3Z2_9DIPT|nr:CLUMA_CG019908, isoform A [Clunio marinus]
MKKKKSKHLNELIPICLFKKKNINATHQILFIFPKQTSTVKNHSEKVGGITTGKVKELLLMPPTKC